MYSTVPEPSSHRSAAEPVINSSLLCISASTSSLSSLVFMISFQHICSSVTCSVSTLLITCYLISSKKAFSLPVKRGRVQLWMDRPKWVFSLSVCVCENINPAPFPALQMFQYFAANGKKSGGLFIFSFNWTMFG